MKRFKDFLKSKMVTVHGKTKTFQRRDSRDKKESDKEKNESTIQVGNKTFHYNINKIKKRADEMYKQRIEQKMTTASSENEMPHNIESIIKQMVKEQFGYKITQTPPYKVYNPILEKVLEDIK